MLHEDARVSAHLRGTRKANPERRGFSEIAERRSKLVNTNALEAQRDVAMQSPPCAIYRESSLSGTLQRYWRTSQRLATSRSEQFAELFLHFTTRASRLASCSCYAPNVYALRALPLDRLSCADRSTNHKPRRSGAEIADGRAARAAACAAARLFRHHCPRSDCRRARTRQEGCRPYRRRSRQ